MRPDEHKKKRSAQYNKKKASNDGRKDNPAAPGSGKADRKNRAPVTSSSKQQQQNTASAAPFKSSDSSDTEEPTVTKQRPTFRRREIVSNWSRYEIAEGDLDGQTQPLPDYSKLLSSAGGASSHFRFKDEEDWGGELSPFTEDSLTTSALDLDLTDLGGALQSVPLYERLAIPPALFTEEQKSEMRQMADAHCVEYRKRDNGDSAERLDSDASDRYESGVSGNTSGNLLGGEVHVCSRTTDVGSNPLNSSNKTDIDNKSGVCTLDCEVRSPKKSFSEQVNRTEQTSSSRSEQKVSNEQIVGLPQNNGTDTQGRVHRVLTTASQEEELDVLLSLGETDGSSLSTTTLDESVNQQMGSTSDKLRPPTLCEGETNARNNQPDHLHTPPGESVVPQQYIDPPVQKNKGSENLEDWLDSILDD